MFSKEASHSDASVDMEDLYDQRSGVLQEASNSPVEEESPKSLNRI